MTTQLVTPSDYQHRLGLGPRRLTNSTAFAFTLVWQPNHVTWAIDGAPLLTRRVGTPVNWTDVHTGAAITCVACIT